MLHCLLNMVMFKALATLKLNVELNKKARAKAEPRDVLAREEESDSEQVESRDSLRSESDARSAKTTTGLKWKNCGPTKPAFGRVKPSTPQQCPAE